MEHLLAQLARAVLPRDKIPKDSLDTFLDLRWNAKLTEQNSAMGFQGLLTSRRCCWVASWHEMDSGN